MSVFNESIAKANGFDLNALSANQRGELLTEQFSLLYAKLTGPVIIIFFSLGFLYYKLTQLGALSGSINLTDVLGDLSIGFKVVGGILAALVIWGIVLVIQVLLDIAAGSVEVVEGTGYRKITTSNDQDDVKSQNLYFVVDKRKFRVKKKGFLAFEDGKHYRAYYTPRSKVLVNVEAVD